MNRLAVSAIIVAALLLLGFFAYLHSLPSWELSASNSSVGLVLQVDEEGKSEPTYEVLLEGKSVDDEFSRLTRKQLTVDQASTRFFDETLKPGRWIVAVEGAELDIMPHRMVLNGGQEFYPAP